MTHYMGLVGLVVAAAIGWAGCQPAVQQEVEDQETPSVSHELAEQQPAYSNQDDAAEQHPAPYHEDDNYIPFRLLAAETVQKDLDLTAEQIGQIDDSVSFSVERMRELASTWHEDPARRTEARTRELMERDMRVARRYKKLQVQVVGMLTPSQRSRLEQIQTQYAVAIALSQPELVRGLDISEEQLKKIRQQAKATILAQPDIIKALEIPKEQLAKIRPPPELVAARGAAEFRELEGLSPEETLKSMLESTTKRNTALAEANERAMDALTQEQRAKLADVIGKQIELSWSYDAWLRKG